MYMESIHFYGTKGEFGCFSNFSAHRVFLKETSWPTTEHYFQAQKFSGSEHEEQIRLAKSPSLAARMGRSRARPLRADWEDVKIDVMRQALRAKFTQHEALAKTLLCSGDRPLVEHTARDRFWGDGGDGSGKNMLGLLLMELRAELRAAQ